MVVSFDIVRCHAVGLFVRGGVLGISHAFSSLPNSTRRACERDVIAFVNILQLD